MTKSIIRQGDILIVPVAAIPATVKPVAPENNRVVLAHGEVTGHHHSFAMSERVALFREDGGGGGLFLSVTNAPAPLEHQEHHALTIAPGHYEVRRQVEYTPAAIRSVED
jgi:hypothetical protein